jgi:hypothetical protein
MLSDETTEGLLVSVNETGDQLRVGHVSNTRGSLRLLRGGIDGGSPAHGGGRR